MPRFRNPGGHRRRVQQSMGDTRKHREDAKRRVQQIDACRFPLPCSCVDCKPEAEE